MLFPRPQLFTGAAIDFTLAPAYSVSSGRMPAVILLAGWKSNSFGSTYSELAERLRVLGCHTLQLSLRGHEGSLGDINTVSRADHVKDIHAAFGYLAERPEVDMSQLFVVAASYGAYLMACLAPQLRSVKGMLLRAPALYPNEGWDEPTVDLVARTDRLEWRRTVRTAADCRAIKGISGYHGNLTLVWSGDDEDLPRQVLDSYADAHPVTSPITVEIIKGASHSLSGEYREHFLNYARWRFVSMLEDMKMTPSA